MRAGLCRAQRWLRHLGEELTALARTPGAAKMSLEEASLTAWVKYYRPDENSVNSAVSYYQKGELVALALDLVAAPRTAAPSTTCSCARCTRGTRRAACPRTASRRRWPSVMGDGGGARLLRPARARHGERARGGPRGGGPARCSAGRPRASTTRAGRRARNGDEGPAPGWLGADPRQRAEALVASVREGSPASQAGLYAEDELVAEARLPGRPGRLWDRLRERGPAGKLRLTVFRRDELVEVEVPLAPQPKDTVWLEPAAAPTPEQRAAFLALCGGELPKKEQDTSHAA